MNVLALDLGTNLGWARLRTVTEAGTVLLGTDKDLRLAKKARLDRRLDIRVRALVDWLDCQGPINLCVFEDVRFASSQAQAHLWASFRGAIWAWAAHSAMQIDCIDTGKLKLWTTGAGNATKEMMAAAAAKRWPWLNTDRLDDNGVDAVCLLQWAREAYRIK